MNAAAQTPRGPLYNDTALYRFFDQLQQADSQVVRILHLGDSHVQAGFLPEAAAAGLKEKFGDAGQGWVFPYNLGGTNGPNTYRWSSPLRWSASRVVDRNVNHWTGPGGMVISTSQPSPSLTFTAKERSISRIKVFYSASSAPQMEHANICIDTAAVPGEVQCAIISPDTSITAFRLSWPGHAGPLRFYGATLENGRPGVRYHAIGINGAQLMHYNQHPATLPAQLSILRPQLLILSFGTNEAFGGVTAAQFREEMSKAVETLQASAPGATVLFTTPPSGMRKKRRIPYRKNKRTYYRTVYRSNPQVAVLREAILAYCRDNGYACWDFYAAMQGDKKFQRAWSRDKLHFNAYGYTLQGTMLFEALAAAYDEWNKK